MKSSSDTPRACPVEERQALVRGSALSVRKEQQPDGPGSHQEEQQGRRGVEDPLQQPVEEPLQQREEGQVPAQGKQAPEKSYEK